MISSVQSNFAGGMNLFSHDSKLGENEYGLAFNLENRTIALSSVKGYIQDEEAPSGFKQGLYAFDKYLLLFNNGLAYYREIDTTEWIQIDEFFLNNSVDYIFAQAVPASTINLLRKLELDTKVNGSVANTNTSLSPIVINGTKAGLVVQDGINQPWIISPEAEATRLQNYVQWTRNSREYVPIMREMAYINGILFGISPDRKKIYRSVSGRPLDFVINVDIDGDKGGNADTVSYAVSYDPLTAIHPLNNGELLVATAKTCYPIEFNYDFTIFQEPTFYNRKPQQVGIINQFSFIDILGDNAFIDTEGVRSFNAVSLITNEGRNSIFNIKIATAFEKIKQEVTESCAIIFNNYAIFSLKTKYGNYIAKYDTTRAIWVSFDSIPAPIKMFAVANESDGPLLFGITEDRLYKFYANEIELEARVQSKALNSGKSSSEVKLRNVRTVFEQSDSKSVVTVTEILNGKRRKSIKEYLQSHIEGIYYPVLYPVTFKSGGIIDNLHFNFERIAGTGWKVSTEIKWKNAAQLLLLETTAEEATYQTPLRQQSTLY